MLKALELVLRALLPLLERRAVAAERQADAAERLERLLSTYLRYSDPTFSEVLNGQGVPLPSDPDADRTVDTSEWGAARDDKTERLEALRAFWFAEHGELLDDERLVQEYDRLYAEAEQRMNPDVPSGTH